jgi:uncharacterized secreted protein with C-terminal beta-propeller domain
MKKPETSPHTNDPDLVGSNEGSSWVVGRNCVYFSSAVAKYRVSIRTPHGWKLYGHFNDLETATYIANIAILVERCEERYVLNKGIGTKDINELDEWRRVPGHTDLERTAAVRHNELMALQEQERLEAARTAETMAKGRRIYETIDLVTDDELIAYIKTSNETDPLFRKAKTELIRRQKRSGDRSAT